MNTNMRTCVRCKVSYIWMKSPSSLKMTYCGSLCEKADLGTTIDTLLQIQRKEVVTPIANLPVDRAELAVAN